MFTISAARKGSFNLYSKPTRFRALFTLSALRAVIHMPERFMHSLKMLNDMSAEFILLRKYRLQENLIRAQSFTLT